MTAMDILEALGQTREELLRGCDQVVDGAENRKSKKTPIPWRKAKYRRAAAGLIAAAAVLLLVYVGSGAFISRSFDSLSSGSSNSTSTAETAEITADTAEEESAVEESEAVEMEEELTTESALEESSTSTTSSEDTTVAAADESVTETGSATLEILQLGEVYIPIFATSSLSDEEFAQRMELVSGVQAEIDAAIAQEPYQTLPVYRFTQSEELAANQGDQTSDTSVDAIEKLGNYPVITAEEAEELLWQGYYLSWSELSGDDIDSAETASVELLYLICAETQIYMPYYQFTVVTEGDMVMDCYVPAVSSEYLAGTLRGGAVE